MYTKTEFSFDSVSKLAPIHAAQYIPEGEVKAVLQIAHGMAEHFERYEGFIEALSEQGIAVFTNDHIGHGGSVKSEEDKGFFGDAGWEAMVLDCHQLYEIAHAKYPEAPYFFFGHSMGSFVAREYIRRYGKELKGAVICGTGGSNPATGIGIALAKMIAGAKGQKHRSKFIDGMAFGAYNKKFEGRTPFDWLTRDQDIVDAYIADPDCGYLFTVNGFIGLFSALDTVSKKDWYEGVPKELPILLIAGSMDPVGNYGKGPAEVCDKLKATGHDKASLILYQECRHEILNESAVKAQVAKDVIEFVFANA